MKVLLMDREQPFDPEASAPANAEQLIADLELETLFAAMANGDRFVHHIAQAGVLASVQISDPDVISYRQAVLADCQRQPEATEAIRAIAAEAITGERHIWGIGSKPDTILMRALQRLQLFMGKLKELVSLADAHADAFASEGFNRFFAMIGEQLPPEYFAAVAEQIEQLNTDAILVSARLGAGNKARDYALRSPWPQRWRQRLSPFHRKGLSFQVADRDQAGARAIGELRDRGLNEAANAAEQSADHIRAFFDSLLYELSFYLSIDNLSRRLIDRGLPLCVPSPSTPGEPRLTARGLYDPCLALTLDGPVVANDLSADGASLVLVTGANQGGKSTFLRAIGLAHVMLQAGMPVAAESFTADPRAGIFTHFKREEDSRMEHGKLDEELERMSVIVERLSPDSLLLSNESFASTSEREGSEIAHQVLAALTEAGVKVAFVTHLYDLAHRLAAEHHGHTLFLRAERADDGERTFKILEGQPLPTSFARDTYAQIFGDELNPEPSQTCLTARNVKE